MQCWPGPCRKALGHQQGCEATRKQPHGRIPASIQTILNCLHSLRWCFARSAMPTAVPEQSAMASILLAWEA